MTNLGRRKAVMLAASMGAAALLAAWGRPAQKERARGQRLNLDTLLPRQFGRWEVDESTEAFVRPAKMQGKVFQVYDQVLERTFVNTQGQRVMLSAAFGSEQSAGLQMHRPEACYPGGGFKVEGVESVSLTLAGQPVAATRLHAHMPGRSEPITYWMVLGGVVVSDSADFRLRQLSFSVRRELLDGMLVRLSSIDSTPATAYALQSEFADELARAMAPQDRAKLIGTAVAQAPKG